MPLIQPLRRRHSMPADSQGALAALATLGFEIQRRWRAPDLKAPVMMLESLLFRYNRPGVVNTYQECAMTTIGNSWLKHRSWLLVLFAAAAIGWPVEAQNQQPAPWLLGKAYHIP